MNPAEPSNLAPIRLVGIHKLYGRFQALAPLDLEIRRGELFGFLGPNGAGKTTTIRIMTGLLRPTGGSVFIAGHDLASRPEEAKRRFGYVPDRPYLYDKLTPEEYFRFLAGLYDVPVDDALERGRRLLDYFSVGGWRDELIEGFSHGMKQKVAMSGALLHDPDIFIIDEPTVGLDPQSVRLFKDLLRDLCSKGKTVFLSTHNLDLAEELCDRIGIIHQGRCIALGTMATLHALASGSEVQRDLEEIFLRLVSEDSTSGAPMADRGGGPSAGPPADPPSASSGTGSANAPPPSNPPSPPLTS